MKNLNCSIKKRLERLADRRHAERLLLHPGTIVATAVLGIALVGVPLTLSSAKAENPAKRATGASSSDTGPVPRTSGPSVSSSADATSGAPAPATPSAPPASEKPEAQPEEKRTELIVFYAGWGDDGYESLKRNIHEIDVLMPMWYHLGNDGRVRSGNPKDEARVMRLIRRENPDMKVMPIVNNYDKPTESWNPEQIDRRLRKPAERRRMAARIVKAMKAKGYDGVNIDFEGFKPASRARLVAFSKELYPRAKKAGLTVSQDVIVGSKTYDHKKLARNVDYLIPMMYDEHWKTSSAGPIASQGWYEKTLRKFVKLVGAKKVVVGMGTYTYNWGRPGQRAKAMTHSEALRLASAKKKKIKFHPQQLNSHFSYKSGSQKRQVWILDAASAHNQVKAASELGVRGYAIWRIGAEDPALWRVLPNRDSLDSGVTLRLQSDRRSVEVDPDSGLVTAHTIRP